MVRTLLARIEDMLETIDQVTRATPARARGLPAGLGAQKSRRARDRGRLRRGRSVRDELRSRIPLRFLETLVVEDLAGLAINAHLSNINYILIPQNADELVLNSANFHYALLDI